LDFYCRYGIRHSNEINDASTIIKIDYEAQITATDSVHEEIRLFEEWMRDPSTGTDSSRHRRMAVHQEIRQHLSRHNQQWFDTELAKLEERRQASSIRPLSLPNSRLFLTTPTSCSLSARML
jgi:hypothetical protein